MQTKHFKIHLKENYSMIYFLTILGNLENKVKISLDNLM